MKGQLVVVWRVHSGDKVRPRESARERLPEKEYTVERVLPRPAVHTGQLPDGGLQVCDEQAVSLEGVSTGGIPTSEFDLPRVVISFEALRQVARLIAEES